LQDVLLRPIVRLDSIQKQNMDCLWIGGAEEAQMAQYLANLRLDTR
jgi:hypothetical protein